LLNVEPICASTPAICVVSAASFQQKSIDLLLVLQLREIAPEFYTPLQCHTSWVWVIWKFISDPEVGPWTRMKRDTREGTDGGQQPIALHKKTAFADITNLQKSPASKGVKSL